MSSETWRKDWCSMRHVVLTRHQMQGVDCDDR